MIMTYNLLYIHLAIDESLFLQDLGIQPKVTFISCLNQKEVRQRFFSQQVVSEIEFPSM